MQKWPEEAIQIIKQLQQENRELKETITKLEKKLRMYENPHTPSSQRRFKGGSKGSTPGGKRGDPEAEYNGHYDEWGWKKDLLLDQKHKVFLAFQNLVINDNEGHALPVNLEKLREIDITVNEITADGKYPTYENIAVAKHQYGTSLFYRPQDGWVHNCKGDLDEINRRYQKYWKHRDFRVHAALESKLNFLFKREDYDWVGAYHRNLHVQRYNRRIKHCVRRYRIERNTNESFNNYLKQHMGFETSLPKKGKDSAFKHTTLCLIAINAVALTRLQNGETKNLTSVAYLT